MILSANTPNFSTQFDRIVNGNGLQIGKLYAYGSLKRPNTRDGGSPDHEIVHAGFNNDEYDVVKIIDIKVDIDFSLLKEIITTNDMPNFIWYRSESSDPNYDRVRSFNRYFKEYIKKNPYIAFASKLFTDNAIIYHVTCESLLNNNTYVITYRYDDMWRYGNCKYWYIKPRFVTIKSETYNVEYCDYKQLGGKGTVKKFYGFTNEKYVTKQFEPFCDKLKDLIIERFQYMWAKLRISQYKDCGPDGQPDNCKLIDIDGIMVHTERTVYEPYHREFLGAFNIPLGYRLPTKAELDIIFGKHRVLKKHTKELNTRQQQEDYICYRTDAGFEFICQKKPGYSNYYDYKLFYMQDNNDINNIDCYYMGVMDMYDMHTHSVMREYGYGSVASEDRNYNSGHMIWVKQTPEEYKNELTLINTILAKHKHTDLIDLFKPFGLKSFDDVESIDFATTRKNPRYVDSEDQRGKTFHKGASNNKMEELKKYIAEAFDCEDVLTNTEQISIQLINKKFTHKLSLDTKNDVNIETFIANIAVLLSRELTTKNRCELRNTKDYYYSSRNPYSVFTGYDWKRYLGRWMMHKKINLWCISRYALELLNRQNSYDLTEANNSEYLEYLTFNLKDGTKITVKNEDFTALDFYMNDFYDDYIQTLDNIKPEYQKIIKVLNGETIDN